MELFGRSVGRPAGRPALEEETTSNFCVNGSKTMK